MGRHNSWNESSRTLRYFRASNVLRGSQSEFAFVESHAKVTTGVSAHGMLEYASLRITVDDDDTLNKHH